jgi:uncharacterized membrane protein YkvA (DUF1232 family)
MKRIRIGRKRRRPSGPRAVARMLIRDLPSLFKLVFRLVRDPAVPRLDKILFGAVALYMMTPIDLIPDFLGVVGWIDDFYLLGLALGRLVVSAGPDRLLQHWDGDPKALGHLVEGVDELGAELPARIRRALRGIVDNPGQLRPRRGGRKRPVVRRIRVDEEDRVHLEE